MTTIYRILILGDFSGRARAVDRTVSTRRVDRDDLDDAIKAIGPELALSLDASLPATMKFAELEDFHPDRLLGRVPLLVSLRELRDARPSSDRPRETIAPSSRTDAAALSLGSGSLLDRIMEGEPDAGGTAVRGIAPQDELSDFLRRAVTPHLANEPSVEQRERAAKVDELTVATLRVLMHHPKFQALESLWRGVDMLTRRLDTDEHLQIHIADVSPGALGSLDPASVVGWSLVVADVALGVEDLPVIRHIAELASSTRTPWVAAARPDLGGAASFGDGSDVDDWDDQPVAAWDEFRRSPAARWLCLTTPRILLRVPYGRASDPCTSLPFEEQDPNAPSHESYLWGNGAFAAALLLGEAAANDDAPATQGTISGLPLHVAKIDGEPTAVPCAEALITQRSMTHLLDRGLTPLVSERDGDSVRVPRLQSVATPALPLGG
ncbi:MAG TPA: type VI secretion system contractile sheath large subunit [Gemmatimonadaceae bacterium]|jgi:type VI secretion system protein ImpC